MTNVTSEILLVGAMYKQPDQYLMYGPVIKSQYDFSDPATRFFYDVFEDYYLTFSQEITENKLNTYCSQNMETFKQYKRYKGWKTIKDMMDMADVNDTKNYLNTVKKFSLIRQYEANGFPAEKILQFKDFEKLTANDIYRIMRSKCDRINSDVSVMDEPVVLTDNATGLVDSYLATPEMGIPISFQGFNEQFRGLLKGKVIFSGCRSNIGKSRLLTKIAADVVLGQGKRMMIISNEMSERDMKNCLITTVINDPVFKAMHGIDVDKTEKEITLGLYHDDATGEYVERVKDENGEYVESEERYISRIKATTEYQKVHDIAEWLENKTKGKLYFHDITGDYSQEAIEIELRRAKVVFSCEVVAIDTMKVDKLESWDRLKMLATSIVETIKELNICGYCTFQLTDDTINCDIFSLNSNNISSSKHIKHPVDILLLNEPIKKVDYDKCEYIAYKDTLNWDEPVPQDLNPKKRYMMCTIDKNRLGSKPNLLLEYDLDRNIWTNPGIVIKKSIV